jgi:hypothetical protein
LPSVPVIQNSVFNNYKQKHRLIPEKNLRIFIRDSDAIFDTAGFPEKKIGRRYQTPPYKRTPSEKTQLDSFPLMTDIAISKRNVANKIPRL